MYFGLVLVRLLDPCLHYFQVENEMINQLDVLVEGGRGDEQYMELFRDM